MRRNSSTCIKRFSNTVSVKTPVPEAVNINAIICDCMSVGNPGCGIVLRSTAFNGWSARIRKPSSSSVMMTPISVSLEINAALCSGTALSIVMSPPVIAAATMNVPVSIRSGMIWWIVPCSLLTPSIRIASVPAPITLPPISLMKLAKSTISGSFAAFSIIVVPFASAAAVMMFSVAPTLGKSK